MAYLPLQDNGCTNFVDQFGNCAPTHELQSDHPAIGAGDCSGIPVIPGQTTQPPVDIVSEDQRGQARVQCDAGSFESTAVSMEGPPGTANEVAPLDLIASQTPDYLWESVVSSPATSYYFLWIENENGVVYNRWYTAADVSCPVAGPSTVCSINPGYAVGGDLSFYIQAYNGYTGPGGGYGAWSSGMSFTNGSPANPGRPSLLSPIGSGVGADTDYTWNYLADATWYQLWVQDDAGTYAYRWYTSAQLGCSSPGSLCTTSGLPTPHTTGFSGVNRHWYVRAYNGTGGNDLYGIWSYGETYTP